jgi:hypothetical protein
MSRKKAKSKHQRNKQTKPYSYLFHVSTQPRKVLQPYRTSFCYDFNEDRTQALLFLCSKKEIKDWIEWVIRKFPTKKFWYIQKTLSHGGYVTLYIHIVRMYSRDLEIPTPRYGNEFVVKKCVRPREIVPIRVYQYKKMDFSKLNSTLQRLNRN